MMQSPAITSSAQKAFHAALLLTGTSQLAELAVLDGIAAANQLQTDLLLGTLKSAVEWRTFRCRTQLIPPGLAPELQLLFSLPPIFRDCFVLRILLGLPPPLCGEILGLSTVELDEAVCHALQRHSVNVSKHFER